MTGKDFDTLNEAYRTKVSEVAPAVAVVGRAVAGVAAKKAGQALAKRLKKDEEEVEEGKHEKPDYIDADGDGDKKEPMKKAFKDKKKKGKTINAAHCNEKATDQRPKDEVKSDDIEEGGCEQVHDELQEPIDGSEKEKKKSKKTAKESINNSNKGNIMSENKSTFDELYESVMSEDEDFELGLPTEDETDGIDELELGDDEGEGGDITVTLSQADVDCLKSILDQVGGGDEPEEELGDEPDPLEAGYHGESTEEDGEVTEEDTTHTKDGTKTGVDPSDGGGITAKAHEDGLGGKSSGTGDASTTDEIDGGKDTGEGKKPGHTKAKGVGKPGSQAV